MNFDTESILERITKIRESQQVSKRALAAKIGLSESAYGRVESGETAMTYKQLANIASSLNMSVIDVITYPEKYVRQSDDARNTNEPIEAILQIRLMKDKRDQVLNLIFGDNNLELLMK